MKTKCVRWYHFSVRKRNIILWFYQQKFGFIRIKYFFGLAIILVLTLIASKF